METKQKQQIRQFLEYLEPCTEDQVRGICNNCFNFVKASISIIKTIKGVKRIECPNCGQNQKIQEV